MKIMLRYTIMAGSNVNLAMHLRHRARVTPESTLELFKRRRAALSSEATLELFKRRRADQLAHKAVQEQLARITLAR